MKTPLLPRIHRAYKRLRAALSVFGVLFVLSLTSAALATPMSGDISISGSARFNKGSLMKASDITGWMSPHVMSDTGGFSPFATAGSGVTMSTPWFFGSSTSFVLWTAGGFTFDLTSSSILSRSRKSLSVDGTGTVTGNGFDGTPGDWTFTFSKGKRHSSGFLFSFTADPPVVTPPFVPPPVGTPPPPSTGTPPPIGPPPPTTGPPPPTQNVPDGGSTLALLSFGLLGLICFRPNQFHKV